jgi:hypothetical protein
VVIVIRLRIKINKYFLLLDEEDYEDEDYRRKKKQSREEKLDAMERKLKNIENLIIQDTSKFYESNEGEL